MSRRVTRPIRAIRTPWSIREPRLAPLPSHPGKFIRLLIPLLAACVSGCGSSISPSAPAAPSLEPSARGGPPSPHIATPAHVFLIVLENRSFAQATSQPYVAQLAASSILFTAYHAVSHPSLPNYLALSSGSTWSIADDRYHLLPAADLGHQMTAAGVSWRAYMEDMTAGCQNSPYPYALKHNPFAYYGGTCPSNVVPLVGLSRDLASGSPPAFSWITPNLCHDGHDCAAASSDAWLRGFVPLITGSPAFRDHGILFITWDEDDGAGDNRVPLIVVSAGGVRGREGATYNHYSLLATIESLLDLHPLGRAATATPLPPPPR